MEIFKKYLYANRFTYILFMAFILIYASTFPLYQLPIVAMIYPAVVCIVCMIVYTLVCFSRDKKRYIELVKCEKAIGEVIEHLPEPEGIIDEQYNELIKKLRKIILDNDIAAGEKYANMIDYYTMWVHQVKTPIASMRLILDGEDTAEARKISGELRRIEQYVEMVLTYLRLDSESSDYVFKEQQLDDLIRSSVKKFARDFIGKRLSLDYEPVERKIITDEKWFCFVLEQILSNALKYTKEGGIRIYIQDDSLIIEDTGIGIATEDLPRIFDRGYTGTNGRIDRKASGIGLYLSKRTCDRLGIALSAASVVGEGTRVCLGMTQSQVNFRD